jgi:hypothetical protein
MPALVSWMPMPSYDHKWHVDEQGQGQVGPVPNQLNEHTVVLVLLHQDVLKRYHNIEFNIFLHCPSFDCWVFPTSRMFTIRRWALSMFCLSPLGRIRGSVF